jgi:RNA polymerase sigma-70 factor (ECF subfamily)
MSRALVEQAQQGDRDAYERLARSAAGRLYRVAYRILRDTDQADDAVQQTLVAIWQDLPSLRDPDRFDAWTYRMIVRQCRAETTPPTAQSDRR